MICCKECVDLLHDYLDGSLDKETTTSLDDHFIDCPPCIAFLNTYKSTTKACREVLSQAEIPDYVRSKLQDFLKKNIDKS